MAGAAEGVVGSGLAQPGEPHEGEVRKGVGGGGGAPPNLGVVLEARGDEGQPPRLRLQAVDGADAVAVQHGFQEPALSGKGGMGAAEKWARGASTFHEKIMSWVQILIIFDVVVLENFGAGVSVNKLRCCFLLFKHSSILY